MIHKNLRNVFFYENLIVEDEEMIVRKSVIIWQIVVWVIIEAADGQEALEAPAMGN